jgi:predicted transcriptional regulator
VKSWIRDWITKHRIAQEAEKTTGSGDQGGAAATREEIALADEMNNLVAEIDRIDKARRTSDKEASEKEKLGEDIRNESLRGLQRRKGSKRKTNNDDAGDDDEADEASSRLGKVPHVTPDKGTRLTRCGGTPESSGGSDDGRSLESLMADFASAKQAGVKGKETTADAELLKAKAALLDAQTRADEAKSRAEMQVKEIESRAKSEEATRTMMIQMANVLGKIAEKL